jgi:hypothetical protein
MLKRSTSLKGKGTPVQTRIDDETPSEDGGLNPTYQESNDSASSSSNGDRGDEGAGGNTSSPPSAFIRYTDSTILQIYVICFILLIILIANSSSLFCLHVRHNSLTSPQDKDHGAPHSQRVTMTAEGR